MRKLVITGLVAASAFAATAAPAGAQYTYDAPAPCATASFLMDKYGIELGMHFPLLEDTLHAVCRQTG
jgi:hypothetical protein